MISFFTSPKAYGGILILSAPSTTFIHALTMPFMEVMLYRCELLPAFVHEYR
jgi:hypothetical protein